MISNLVKPLVLIPEQWKLFASAFSNIAQAIILFSLAALFVPEVVSLSTEFPKLTALIYLLGGLILLSISVTISKRGK